MGEVESSRSRELDELRRLLFPNLSPEDGWKHIDNAFRGASDTERQERIEEIAADLELDAVLLRKLRELLADLARHPDSRPD